MSVVVITPREGDLVDLALAKGHLRVDHGDHDALIRAHIEAAASWTERWTGLALGIQTLRLDIKASLTRDGLVLPRGPVVSISGITFDNAVDDDPVEVAADLYLTDANRVRLKRTAAWPGPFGGPMSITYVAGYAADAMPKAIQSAILLHLNILYEQPEDKELAALERARDDLLSPFRERTF